MLPAVPFVILVSYFNPLSPKFSIFQREGIIMLGNYQYMCIEFVHITLIYAQTLTVWEVIVMTALVLEETIHHVS